MDMLLIVCAYSRTEPVKGQTYSGSKLEENGSNLDRCWPKPGQFAKKKRCKLLLPLSFLAYPQVPKSFKLFKDSL